MRKIVFNGKAFIKKNKRGVQRYTCEIISALDKYAIDKNIEVLIPNVDVELPKLKNIKFIKFGGNITIKGWQYLSYQYYILKNNALSISLSADVAPFIKPGIVAIHDMAILNEKKFFSSVKNKILYFKNYIKHKYTLFIYYMAVKNAKKIITVSNFSKEEIAKYYNIDDISVIYNAWEQLKNIKIDEETIRKKYKNIINTRYYFFLGGRDKYKNIKWICEIAKKYKDRNFIIAGPPIDKYSLNDDIDLLEMKNIIYIGYITDEEIAFFMKNCRAFLFPSLYEGFGIPPLEALYFGAKVFCAKSTCLPEIYKDYVVYFSADNYNVDLDYLESLKVKNRKDILKIYSWDKSAKMLLDIIELWR